MSNKVDRGRTRARSQALQLLFQAEAAMRPVDEVIDGDYLISKQPLDPYAVELARGSYEHLDRIDTALAEISDNWDLERMPGADRNLLRISVFEMRLADEPLEDAVVINEAVEIAKAFGTDESAGFVNGVLGRISREGALPAIPGDGEPEPPEGSEPGEIAPEPIRSDFDARDEGDDGGCEHNAFV